MKSAAHTVLVGTSESINLEQDIAKLNKLLTHVPSLIIPYFLIRSNMEEVNIVLVTSTPDYQYQTIVFYALGDELVVHTNQYNIMLVK